MSTYKVESFDEIAILDDYISITVDSKSGGYDTQQGYEGILLNKSYSRDYWGKISPGLFDITIAAYDAFSDTCYGPIELKRMFVGPGYKSNVTIQILDKSEPQIRERFNKVYEWTSAQ